MSEGYTDDLISGFAEASARAKHEYEVAKTTVALPHDVLVERLDAVIASDSISDVHARLLAAALHSVLNRHRPRGIYQECDHEHTDEDLAAGLCLDIDEVGYVCQVGLMYSVCSECCSDGDYAQGERCADGHEHHLDGPICMTVGLIEQTIAGRL